LPEHGGTRSLTRFVADAHGIFLGAGSTDGVVMLALLEHADWGGDFPPGRSGT